jgi:cell wall assembly regulator SMI1
MDYSFPIFDRLQDCWDPISEGQLARLEYDLGVNFPEEYRGFLLRFNGGDWGHLVKSRVQSPSRFADEIAISVNYGIVVDDRFACDDILHNAEVFSGRIPDTLVPIMSSLGDLVCINIGTDNYGKVYYWNKYHEGADFNLLYLIAESFDEFLLSLTPDTETDCHREELPAFVAVEAGDRAEVTQYLRLAGKVELRNAHGWTLLMCAARNSWPKIVEMLIGAGADINARDPDGWTPLRHAVFGGSLDSIKCLIGAGADTGYRDSQGRTLAEIAKELHHHRVQYHLEQYVK